MENFGHKYFDNVEYLETIEEAHVIATGDGVFITEVANEVSDYFDYDSMWRFEEAPVFKPKRIYKLWFDGNYLTVSREDTKAKDLQSVINKLQKKGIMKNE